MRRVRNLNLTHILSFISLLFFLEHFHVDHSVTGLFLAGKNQLWITYYTHISKSDNSWEFSLKSNFLLQLPKTIECYGDLKNASYSRILEMIVPVMKDKLAEFADSGFAELAFITFYDCDRIVLRMLDSVEDSDSATNLFGVLDAVFGSDMGMN